MFTKKPISFSVPDVGRPVIGTPITTSGCPDQRLSTVARAASNAMNGVTPYATHSWRRALVSSSESLR